MVFHGSPASQCWLVERPSTSALIGEEALGGVKPLVLPHQLAPSFPGSENFISIKVFVVVVAFLVSVKSMKSLKP